eukprot:12341214-Alexandrium_andersonii.AAC.1
MCIRDSEKRACANAHRRWFLEPNRERGARVGRCFGLGETTTTISEQKYHGRMLGSTNLHTHTHKRKRALAQTQAPVSYTHLTLPTICSV